MGLFSNVTFNLSIPNSTANSSLVDTPLYNYTTTGNQATEEPNLSLITVTYVGLLVGIIVFALLGNLLVILVYLFDHRLQISSSYYMLSLAVSDVITASLVMTFEVDQLMNNLKWRHPRALCQVWTTMYLFTVPVSILTACLSSIDRWYAITRPLKYRTGRNSLKRKAIAAILFAWVYSILFALIPKMGWNPPGMSVGVTTDVPYCYFDIMVEYSVLSSVLNFITPSLVTAFFYYHMFSAMQKHTSKRRKLSSHSDFTSRSPSQRNYNERKSLLTNINVGKSYALIGSLLVITWCPFTIFSIINNICMMTKSCTAVVKVPHVEFTLLMLGYFNSALNPVVYVLRFRAFRLTIRDWLSCKKRCAKSQFAMTKR